MQICYYFFYKIKSNIKTLYIRYLKENLKKVSLYHSPYNLPTAKNVKTHQNDVLSTNILFLMEHIAFLTLRPYGTFYILNS